MLERVDHLLFGAGWQDGGREDQVWPLRVHRAGGLLGSGRHDHVHFNPLAQKVPEMFAAGLIRLECKNAKLLSVHRCLTERQLPGRETGM